MRKRWNIVVVSNTSDRGYCFDIGMRTLALIVVGLSVLIVSIVSWTSSAKTLREDNARLAERLDREIGRQSQEAGQYRSELEALNDRFEELLTLESELREASGLDRLYPQPEKSRAGGQGGRSESGKVTSYPDGILYQDTLVRDENLSAETLLRETAITRDRFTELLATLKKERKRLAGLPLINPVACPDAWISSSFGRRKDPITGKRRFHEGLDIVAWRGTPIIAPADGVVIAAGWRPGLGRTIEIDHGYGYRTTYGHNDKLLVKRGDRVKRGDIIARLGNTGRSTGPHLHYEIQLNGKLINPYRYVKR